MVLEENGEHKMVREVTNELVIERIGEKRTLLDNILRREVIWIGPILRRNCLLHHAIEGQTTKVKGVGRRTQPIDDLRNRRRYYEISREKNIFGNVNSITVALPKA